MLEWIVALILLGAFVAYVGIDYHTRRYDREAFRRLPAENQRLLLLANGQPTEHKADTTHPEQDVLQALRNENQRLRRSFAKQLAKHKADTTFAATLEKAGIDTIEDTLHAMISRAQSEILIVTPWIKEGAWQRINGRVAKFCKNGGVFRIYIRGIDEDFSSSRCDRSVVNDIRRFGGVVTCVPDLHAKLYVIDQREALITSANLTRSGLDFGLEAGVWTCNPALVQEVYRFVEKLTAA